MRKYAFGCRYVLSGEGFGTLFHRDGATHLLWILVPVVENCEAIAVRVKASGYTASGADRKKFVPGFLSAGICALTNQFDESVFINAEQLFG